MYDLERKYYTYALLDPRKPGAFFYGSSRFDHEPFYIGKGTGYRMTAHFTQAKRLMREMDAKTIDITNPDPPPTSIPLNEKEEAKLFRIIEIIRETGDVPIAIKLLEGVNEFESFEHEAMMIRTIGRAQKRMGPLTNENDGEQFTGPMPIRLQRFVGMNNIRSEGEPSVYKQGGFKVCEPRVVLNADVNGNGRIIKRKGRQMFVPLPGAHSLWANKEVMLVVADGIMYRISGTTPVELTHLSGPGSAKVYYAEANDLVYFSNEWNQGVFDPNTNQIDVWGQATPQPPLVAAIAGGSLRPGRYLVCSAFLGSDGMFGPASSVTSVTVTEEGQKLIFSDIPAEAQVFVSEADGAKLYRVGHVLEYAEEWLGSDHLETLGLIPPPFGMTNIKYAYGRIWGAVGNILYYSEPYRLDLFSELNHFKFSEKITMIAPVYSSGEAGTQQASSGGIYVGLENKAVFLAGSNPNSMVEKIVGSGVTAGTLAYCNNVPELGNMVPVWVSQDGIVAGTGGGSLLNLTSDKVRFNPGKNGAALYRKVNGEFQYMTNFQRSKSSVGSFEDHTTCEVIRNGRVIS